MAAATTAAKLGAYDGNDLDALLTQKRVGVGVAIICEDDTRTGANEIGTTVPLRAFAHIIITARFNDT